MSFIELTKIKGHPISFNPYHIKRFYGTESGTKLVDSDGNGFDVIESYDKVKELFKQK